jgi:hypothetical protein
VADLVSSIFKKPSCPPCLGEALRRVPSYILDSYGSNSTLHQRWKSKNQD